MEKKIKPSSQVYNIDCLEFMRGCKDKEFSLGIADPPYQIGTRQIDKRKSSYKGAGKLRGRILNQSAGKFSQWDKTPPREFFDELFRVCENVIIWGGNYFDLPPTRCFVCWDKVQPWPNFSQCEYAWTSFDKPAKLFKYDNRRGGKIHPTQKPVELYAYLLNNFAKSGDNIFDPMLGSGSSRIAAYKLGFDFVGCEIDKEYYDQGCERFVKECFGIVGMKDGTTAKQLKLF